MNNRQPKYSEEVYENYEMPSDDMDTDIQNYTSKLLITRKETNCSYCGKKINKGDYALAERGFLDGQPFYIHDCLDCVEETMMMQNGELDADDMMEMWESRARESGFI